MNEWQFLRDLARRSVLVSMMKSAADDDMDPATRVRLFREELNKRPQPLPDHMRGFPEYPKEFFRRILPEVGQFFVDESFFLEPGQSFRLPAMLPKPVLDELRRMGIIHPLPVPPIAPEPPPDFPAPLKLMLQAFRKARFQEIARLTDLNRNIREHNSKLIGLLEPRLHVYWPKYLAPFMPRRIAVPAGPSALPVHLPLRRGLEEAWREKVDQIYEDHQWNQAVVQNNIRKFLDVQERLEKAGLPPYKLFEVEKKPLPRR